MYILVVGNACTGKSALINKMIGKGEAREHEERVDERRKLGKINAYNYSVEGVSATFLDTPGLHGGKCDDVEYVCYMKEIRCDKADRLLYCIKMSNTRFQQEDRETITILTKELGKEIWKNAVFVLTFANDVVARLERKHKHHPNRKPVHKAFKELVSTWKKVLSAEVEKTGIDSKVAKSIPVVPAGYELNSIEKSYLEDGNDWKEALWQVCTCKVQRPQDSCRKLQLFAEYAMQSVSRWLWDDSRDPSDGESEHKQTSPLAVVFSSELEKSPSTNIRSERESLTRTKQADWEPRYSLSIVLEHIYQ